MSQITSQQTQAANGEKAPKEVELKSIGGKASEIRPGYKKGCGLSAVLAIAAGLAIATALSSCDTDELMEEYFPDQEQGTEEPHPNFDDIPTPRALP